MYIDDRFPTKVRHTTIVDVYKRRLHTCTFAKPTQYQLVKTIKDIRLRGGIKSEGGSEAGKVIKRVWGKKGGCEIIASPKTRGTISILFRYLC